MKKTNIFYELRHRTNAGTWVNVGYFKTKKDAVKFQACFNTKTQVCPTDIIEREFLKY